MRRIASSRSQVSFFGSNVRHEFGLEFIISNAISGHLGYIQAKADANKIIKPVRCRTSYNCDQQVAMWFKSHATDYPDIDTYAKLFNVGSDISDLIQKEKTNKAIQHNLGLTIQFLNVALFFFAGLSLPVVFFLGASNIDTGPLYWKYVFFPFLCMMGLHYPSQLLIKNGEDKYTNYQIKAHLKVSADIFNNMMVNDDAITLQKILTILKRLNDCEDPKISQQYIESVINALEKMSDERFGAWFHRFAAENPEEDALDKLLALLFTPNENDIVIKDRETALIEKIIRVAPKLVAERFNIPSSSEYQAAKAEYSRVVNSPH